MVLLLVSWALSLRWIMTQLHDPWSEGGAEVGQSAGPIALVLANSLAMLLRAALGRMFAAPEWENKGKTS